MGDYPIPFVVMIPERIRKNTVILYLDPDGKNVQAEQQYFYKSFLENGHIVVIPDLINTGEVGPTEYRGDATIDGMSSNIWYMAVQNAVSMVGLRASDVNRLAGYIRQRFPEREIVGASRGDMNAVLLHASVMNPQIKALAMLQPLISYASIAMNPFYSMENLYSAPGGVLTAYDLPDLAACLAPNPILMLNPVDQGNQPVPLGQMNDSYAFTYAVYHDREADRKLTIKNNLDPPSIRTMVANWLD
ncbi:hypothetical protein GF373_15120 [bacterium]|nr:hypothetical protein [bacterium]